MYEDNVCKFNFNQSSDLICRSFICERFGRQAIPARSPYHAVCLVLAGEGRLLYNGAHIALSVGTLFWLREGDVFSVESTNALQYYYIHFYGRRADELMHRLPMSDEGLVYRGCDALLHFWEDCFLMAEDGNIDVICEAVLLYSFAKLRPIRTKQSNVVTQMIMLIQENFTDPELSMSVIAQKLGYDAKYLSSLFKREKGIAYAGYLRQLRIKHAIFLMEEGVLSVKNIAILCGYRDAFYFSKIFTQSEGISPTVYMQRVSKTRNADERAQDQKDQTVDRKR